MVVPVVPVQNELKITLDIDLKTNSGNKPLPQTTVLILVTFRQRVCWILKRQN